MTAIMRDLKHPVVVSQKQQNTILEVQDSEKHE